MLARPLPVHVRRTSHAWLVLVALMAIGAWIRHFFNLRHAGRTVWWIPVDGGARRSPRSRSRSGLRRPGARRPRAPARAVRASAVDRRSSAACRATRRARRAWLAAPLGDPARHRRADRTRRPRRSSAWPSTSSAMPLGNATGMTDGRARRARRAGSARARRSSRSGRARDRRAGDFRFAARLEEEAAPATVAAFRRLLPLDEPGDPRAAGAARRAGSRSATSTSASAPRTRRATPRPASCCSTRAASARPRSCSRTARPAFASKAGALAGNHFATVTEGVEHLAELGRKALWEGAQPLRITEA